MSLSLALVTTVALLAGGLACGSMAATALGFYPLMQRMPYTGYVSSVQFLWPRFDPVMPVLNVSAAAGNVALAVLAPTAASRGAYAAAVLLLAAVVFISVRKNVPVNRYVVSLDPQAAPPDWEARDPRRQWQRWNLQRTALALLALLTTATGTVLALTH